MTARYRGREDVAELARSDEELHSYFKGVAQARYVMRKIMRIVDDQAKARGLDPLHHQALIQVLGSRSGSTQVNELAERLDIVPAFASRIIKDLEARDLVVRRGSQHDKRVTLVEVTNAGSALLHQIDQDVQLHVDYFQKQLSKEERESALGIFAFYAGSNIGPS